MDASLFHFINSDLSNKAFDAFFPWFTNVHHTLLFKIIGLPLIFALLFWSRRWWGIAIGLCAALFTWAADELSAHLIKPFFLRTRPFDAGLDVILRIGKPGGTSFPSSHTLDAFFLATFLGAFFPRARLWLFTLAVLMGFSRIYCGVHYPGDVLGGAMFGCAFGLACALILSTLSNRRTS